MVFAHDLLGLTISWCDLVVDEVTRWPDLATGDPTRTRALLDALVRDAPVVT